MQEEKLNRKKGPGRPPLNGGLATVPLSIRISPKLRERLLKESHRRRISLSQTTIVILEIGLSYLASQ